MGLTRSVARALHDSRRQASCDHSQKELLKQRVYALTLGYEDLDDHAELRHDLAFGLALDKDTVRLVLAVHYNPNPGNRGPSWLTMIGHAKDSPWSVDLFRCESIVLNYHWVMVVMDQYTRRIIGFAVHAGNVDGPAVCRMLNHATSRQGWPKYISSDNDPLFQYYLWIDNLRVLEIEEIKSLPHVPMSHPFVERMIGSIRRELLDQTFFWTTADLENKLQDYQR